MKIASLALALVVALAAIGSATAAAPLKAPPGHQKPVKSTSDCSDELGYLRRVYEEQVAGVEDASIVPICQNDDVGLMRSDGNAGAIRQEIAANEDIMEALDLANFNIEDVVAVKMTGDESAVIYVHTFHYR